MIDHSISTGAATVGTGGVPHVRSHCTTRSWGTREPSVEHVPLIVEGLPAQGELVVR